MNALITRRALLRGGLAVGAGLTVGFPVARGARGAALAQTAGVFAPNQWLRIDRDGVVTIVNSVPEMGQGSLTTTSMIIADELDAILDQVRVEQAPANPALYKNPVTGTQSYGGSRGVRDHLAMWRKAAAAAREMLAQAAADEWGVPVESVETEQGAVVDRPSGRRLLYGQLVDRAQQLPVPQNPTLKSPDKFRYIGKPVKRRDTPEKITGRGIYGTDVQVPGMLVASIERCPVFGGKVKSVDATAATRVKGVKHVVQVSNGIAVVADGFWTALQGRRALRVTWDEGPMAQVSSTMITREYEAAAKQPGGVARNDGDAEKVLAAGGRVHEAVYQVPFLEHACMEPMNATAPVMPDACVVWAPTQNPGGTQATAARGILSQQGRAQAGTIDAAAVEAVRNMPYDVPNLRIEWTNKDLGIPLGFWRSVGPSQNGFIIESFIDELAHLAGKDPYEYRRALLGKAPRHKAVLELAATRANWGAPLPTGHTRGIAVAFSYGSYDAHVAEVSVARDGAVRTHRLVAAIDAGLAVNPENVKAQMEGGAVYALTAALYGRITIDRGRVQQSNFHDYPMLRINEMPVVEVHILDSGEAPGGLGEPGVPTVAPAVCNAIYAATGRRIRTLPINRDELKRA